MAMCLPTAMDRNALRDESVRVWQRQSGIYRATDALKMLMAGADVTTVFADFIALRMKHIQVIVTIRCDGWKYTKTELVEQLKAA